MPGANVRLSGRTAVAPSPPTRFRWRNLAGFSPAPSVPSYLLVALRLEAILETKCCTTRSLRYTEGGFKSRVSVICFHTL